MPRLQAVGLIQPPEGRSRSDWVKRQSTGTAEPGPDRVDRSLVPGRRRRSWSPSWRRASCSPRSCSSTRWSWATTTPPVTRRMWPPPRSALRSVVSTGYAEGFVGAIAQGWTRAERMPGRAPPAGLRHGRPPPTEPARAAGRDWLPASPLGPTPVLAQGILGSGTFGAPAAENPPTWAGTCPGWGEGSDPVGQADSQPSLSRQSMMKVGQARRSGAVTRHGLLDRPPPGREPVVNVVLVLLVPITSTMSSQVKLLTAGLSRGRASRRDVKRAAPVRHHCFGRVTPDRRARPAAALAGS
jgi:hypothetical protein